MRHLFLGLLSCLCYVSVLAPAHAAADPVKIYLDWWLNPHHALFVVGKAQGYFKKHGLNVTYYMSENYEEAARQVLAGAGDLAVSHARRLRLQRNKNIPLKKVMTLIDHPLECLIVKGRNLTEPNLKGKRLGHGSSGMGFTEIMIDQILAHEKLTRDDITLMRSRNLPQAFLTGQVDAVVNVYQTYGIADIESHTTDFTVFTLDHFNIKPYAQMILVCHDKQSTDPRWLKLKQALQETLDYIKHNPRQAWQDFVKAHPELNNKINKKTFSKVIDHLVVQ